jgi:hypothetical protein
VDATTVTLRRRVLVVVILVAVLVGMAVKTVFFHDSSRGSVARRDAEARGPGPKGVDDYGVPFGFARSPAGARAAAVAFVGLGDLVLSSPEHQREAALRAMAARPAEDAFVEAQAASFDALRDALSRGSGPARLRAGVLATKVAGYTPTRARVRLWRVLVLSREGMTSPAEQWATVTYELVWERGDWRIWSEDNAPGPTPAATDPRPGTPAALETHLSGFDPHPER